MRFTFRNTLSASVRCQPLSTELRPSSSSIVGGMFVPLLRGHRPFSRASSHCATAWRTCSAIGSPVRFHSARNRTIKSRPKRIVTGGSYFALRFAIFQIVVERLHSGQMSSIMREIPRILLRPLRHAADCLPRAEQPAGGLPAGSLRAARGISVELWGLFISCRFTTPHPLHRPQS
jgi:hypothetical protein